MRLDRKGRAVWNGGLKDGNGVVSTASGGLRDADYTFASRFEQGGKSDPEELVAAALAACFSMALSGQLAEVGMTPSSVETEATATLEKTEAGPTVTKIHLAVTVKASGGDESAFKTATENAKKGCPISRLYNAEITMDARLAR
jgi:lipoyl-dependent peroxiredoxin